MEKMKEDQVLNEDTYTKNFDYETQKKRLEARIKGLIVDLAQLEEKDKKNEINEEEFNMRFAILQANLTEARNGIETLNSENDLGGINTDEILKDNSKN